MRLPKEIIKLKVDEVSSVDNPATGKKFLVIKNEDSDEGVTKRTMNDVLDNQEARSEMWKAVDAFYTAVNDTLRDDTLSESETAEQITASTEQLTSKLNEIAPDLAKNLDVDEMVKNVKGKVSKKGGGNMPELKDLLSQIEDEEVRKGIQSQVDALEEKVETLEEASGEEEETVNKSEMPEELRKRFEDMEKKAKEAEDIAKAERAKRLDVEFTKRAQEYSHVADTDKVKEILMKSSEIGEEFNSTLEEVLKSAQERLSKNDLFGESGDTGQSTTDAEATIEKKTQEVLEKNSDMTYAQAQREVIKKHADLYADYVNQKSAN